MAAVCTVTDVFNPGTWMMDFGTVAIGTYLEKTFRITNSGDGNLSGTISFSFVESGFSLIGITTYNLNAGEYRDFTLRFTPDSEDVHGCTIDLGNAICTHPVYGTGQGTTGGTFGQFSTDFSEYTTNAQPDDWTKIWNDADVTWLVQTHAGEGITGYGTKALEVLPTGTTRRALYWNDIGDEADVDVVARIRIKTSTAIGQMGIGVRMSGASGAEYGYALRTQMEDNKLFLEKRVNGTTTTLESYTFEAWYIDMNFNVWYLIRFQAHGTALKGKLWAADEDEPATWNIEITDSSISAAGKTGIMTRKEGYIDWFGVGIGTSEPPALPAAEGLGRLTQAIMEIQRTGYPYGRLTQAVLEILSTSSIPRRRNFLIYEIDHNLDNNRIKYKGIEIPELLP